MHTNKTYLILALLPLVLAACGKTSSVPAEETETIRFAAPAQTRAALPVDDKSSKFEIRDWYDAGAYGVGDATASVPYYINNTLEYGGTSWGYGTVRSYPWLQSSHLFFGWLMQDGMGSSDGFFGTNPGITLSGTTLSIPATTIDKSTAPYDFLYSDPVYRKSSDGDFSPVQFTFKHLFARVAISFRVTGDRDEIKLKNVYLNPFANTKSATIAFANDGATVNLTAGGTLGSFITPVDFNLSGYTKSSVPIDVLSQTQTATKVFYNVWPLENSELPAIHLIYQLSDEIDRVTDVSFPTGTTWEAGNQYSYTVTYVGNHLKIVGNVQPWDQTTVTYSSSAAEDEPIMATWLGWDPSTCTFVDDDPLEAKFKPGVAAIKGRFRIYSPTECSYTISLEDDSNFEIVDGSGTVGTNGNVKAGETIEFSVTRGPGLISEPGTDVATGLSFKILVSGRDYSLDSEIQKDGPLKVIIPGSN